MPSVHDFLLWKYYSNDRNLKKSNFQGKYGLKTLSLINKSQLSKSKEIAALCEFEENFNKEFGVFWCKICCNSALRERANNDDCVISLGLFFIIKTSWLKIALPPEHNNLATWPIFQPTTVSSFICQKKN